MININLFYNVFNFYSDDYDNIVLDVGINFNSIVLYDSRENNIIYVISFFCQDFLSSYEVLTIKENNKKILNLEIY